MDGKYESQRWKMSVPVLYICCVKSLSLELHPIFERTELPGTFNYEKCMYFHMWPVAGIPVVPELNPILLSQVSLLNQLNFSD
jgi:hypothetical protein